MEKLGLIAALFLAFLVGSLVTAGTFMPIVNTGLKLEATRVVLSNAGDKFVDVYRQHGERPQQQQGTVPAELYYRPLQRPGRHPGCRQVWNGQIYEWRCV